MEKTKIDYNTLCDVFKHVKQYGVEHIAKLRQKEIAELIMENFELTLEQSKKIAYNLQYRFAPNVKVSTNLSDNYQKIMDDIFGRTYEGIKFSDGYLMSVDNTKRMYDIASEVCRFLKDAGVILTDKCKMDLVNGIATTSYSLAKQGKDGSEAPVTTFPCCLNARMTIRFWRSSKMHDGYELVPLLYVNESLVNNLAYCCKFTKDGVEQNQMYSKYGWVQYDNDIITLSEADKEKIINNLTPEQIKELLSR